MARMTEQEEAKADTWYDRIPMWAFVAFFTAMIGFAALAWALTKSDAASAGDPVSARSACHTYVEQRLKSPGSADFSGESTDVAGSTWVVTGSVDSENSFGGSVRNSFRCTVTYSGDRTWNLDGLTLTGN
jgi:hypothetical protein